jgi:carotenoid 1,2-hydratase
VSDDGRLGLTLILMIGSVFSPHYRRAVAQGRGDPERHAAVNLALYNLAKPGGSWLGPVLGKRSGDLWVLTEGGKLLRDAATMTIGSTKTSWDGAALRVQLREVTAPFASPIEGELVVRPAGVAGEMHALDAEGKHVWSPIAPFGRIEVKLSEPSLSWRGDAYLDHNAGDEPLARGFSGWTWSRVTSRDKTVVVYDAVRKDGSEHRIARAFHAGGGRESLSGEMSAARLGKTGWQIERSIRTAGATRLSLGRTLEDTPFYARSHLVGTLDGLPASGVHEVVDLRRFESSVVQHMLPYRMRRA